MTSAVVFAYHDVGVRCLKTLLAHGIQVPMVLTHRDDAAENVWFGNVAATAADYGIETLTPDDANAPAVAELVRARAPDFIFSFYYRRMIGQSLLELPARGALNMHGSLLPAFRGRAPVNWAVIKGAVRTGATLHYMVEKPDAGDIVDQQPVPILPDDTAIEVFQKVTVAAELVLDRSLPALIAGTAARRPQNLAQGSYFGGRRPEDGRIDWRAPAKAVHDLVRGVAPPYPGAFFELDGRRVLVLKTLRQPGRRGRFPAPTLFQENGGCFVQCGDGGILRLERLQYDGEMLSPSRLAQVLGPFPAALLEPQRIQT